MGIVWWVVFVLVVCWLVVVCWLWCCVCWLWFGLVDCIGWSVVCWLVVVVVCWVFLVNGFICVMVICCVGCWDVVVCVCWDWLVLLMWCCLLLLIGLGCILLWYVCEIICLYCWLMYMGWYNVLLGVNVCV